MSEVKPKMDCRNVILHLDDHLDGQLDATQHAAVQEHLERCPQCRRRYQQAAALRAVLRSLPVPAPRPGFVQEALARATLRAQRRAERRSTLGVALAASLVLGVALGMLVAQRPAERPDPVVSLVLEQPEIVRLAFNAARPLTGVTLSLTLPENVEIVGYAGRRELTWQTDLREGVNLLELPLVAYGPTRGELVAHLAHGASSKTFRVKIQTGRAEEAAMPSIRLATS